VAMAAHRVVTTRRIICLTENKVVRSDLVVAWLWPTRPLVADYPAPRFAAVWVRGSNPPRSQIRIRVLLLTLQKRLILYNGPLL
jgi:hypothetical protein